MKMPEGWEAQMDKMHENATAWRAAHPDTEVKIQFNFPDQVCLIAPISEALKHKFIVTNEAGLELIKALWPMDVVSEATVLMVKIILEHEDKSFATAGQVCPQCGKHIDRASPAPGQDGPARPPEDGDLTLCLGCASILTFAGGTLVAVDEQAFAALDRDTQRLLRNVQADIRRKSPGPG